MALKNPFLFGKDFQVSSTGTRQAVHCHSVTCGQQPALCSACQCHLRQSLLPGHEIAVEIEVNDLRAQLNDGQQAVGRLIPGFRHDGAHVIAPDTSQYEIPQLHLFLQICAHEPGARHVAGDRQPVDPILSPFL